MRMKNGENFLDLGCCFGQDLRELVADGAPSENIYGLDIEGPLIDVGYDLFMDRGKIKSTLVFSFMKAYTPGSSSTVDR